MSNLKPNLLLDTIKAEFDLDTDADLCRLLDVFQSPISRIRRGAISVGDSMIVRIHEKTDIPVKRIKELAAA